MRLRCRWKGNDIPHLLIPLMATSIAHSPRYGGKLFNGSRCMYSHPDLTSPRLYDMTSQVPAWQRRLLLSLGLVNISFFVKTARLYHQFHSLLSVSAPSDIFGYSLIYLYNVSLLHMISGYFQTSLCLLIEFDFHSTELELPPAIDQLCVCLVCPKPGA